MDLNAKMSILITFRKLKNTLEIKKKLYFIQRGIPQPLHNVCMYNLSKKK